ncbi:hypothetical protein DLAC_02811 [Tieghemostelium lacteum]|uniref:Uncharacterized protein n=1 Tax=Tieghemostelium lacteum TaxID=361077 RepID=A0A152A3E8_TIELA|nr:hypothetical protein DLAC_02811 [Tieghemostelium lacteum]|eukprot:KYR00768.1 hypothetical protein DLAC_02811 [Tieghemostelium lacteum]
MKSIVVLVLLLITVLAVKSEIKAVINRSGDIIIQTPKDSSSKLFLKGNVYNGNSLTSIQDVEVSNLISHVMGLLPLNNQQKDRSSFPNVSIFNKPKLSLQFNLASISEESIKDDLTFLQNGISIEKTFYPMDSISELATIATGVTPDVHGIVASEWFANGQQKVQAYGKKSQSQSANVADLLSQSFGGKSLILSSSYCKKFTAAMALHQSLSSKNSYGFYSNKGITIENLSQQSSHLSEMILTPGQVETIIYSKAFKEFVLPSDTWSLSLNSGIIQITEDNGKTFYFNLDSDTDRALLTELVMVFHTVQTLQKSEHFHKLALDAVPDMLTFSFTGHKQIGVSHQNPEIQRLALTMINNAMKSTYESLSTVYGGKVACSVVALAPAASHKEYIDRIEQALDNGVSVPLSESFPHVYLPQSQKESQQEICQKVQNAIQELKVHCIESHTYSKVLVNADANTTSSSSYNSQEALEASADTNQVAAFQIFLFFPILWVLFILGGALLMMKISSDAQKDTLLYRNSNRQY